MTERKAVLLMLAVALFWGFGFVAVQFAVDDNWSPLLLVAVRFLLAGGLLAIIFHKKLAHTTRADIIAGLITGVLTAGGFVFQTWGQAESSPAVTAFVTSIYVVLVPLADFILFRKKPHARLAVAVALACAGITLITVSGRIGVGFGVFLVVVSTVFFAVQVCALGHYVAKIDVSRLTAIMLLFTGIISLVMFGVGAAIVPPELPRFTLKGVTSVLYLGIFSSALCYLGQTIGQKYTTATKAAIILSTESVFGALLSVLIYKEVLQPRMIVGCVIVFAAILLAETNFIFRRKKHGSEKNRS